MVPAALVSMLLFAGVPVRVESGDCPSGAQIEEMLAAMLPSLPEGAQPDVARVKKRTVGLRIELSQSDGRVIAERHFDRTGSCTELAELAATAIAGWEKDAHPELARPQMSPTPGPSVLLPMAERPTPKAYDLALGASLSHAGSYAVGGVLALTWMPWGTGLGIRIHGAAESERTLDLGDNQARWRRWMGGAELNGRLARLPMDFHGGLTVGWLKARGVDFTLDNRPVDSFSPAATMGVRWAWWATRHFALWLDLIGLYWVRKQTLTAESPDDGRRLPQWQAVASAGLAFGQIASGR